MASSSLVSLKPVTLSSSFFPSLSVTCAAMLRIIRVYVNGMNIREEVLKHTRYYKEEEVSGLINNFAVIST